MGTLNSELKGQQVYLDTNVFIYALEGVEPWSSTLRDLFVFIESGQTKAITSELAITECLVRPFAYARYDLVQLYVKALTQQPGMTTYPVKMDILVAAARLRAEIGLKLPDAIHAATAQISGCTTLLTNDAGFKRLTGIKTLLISEWA